MAFQTALSGLNASRKDLDVVSNNIANSNTTGFKKSRAEFADIYANTISGSSGTQAGAGVAVSNIAQQFSQGNVEFTDNNLDLAINGEGFFTVKDADGALNYTRSGMFSVDREGYVVNSHGQKLQSYAVDNQGNATNLTPDDLRLTTGSIPAQETREVDLNINLDADATQPGGAITTGYPVAAGAEPTPDEYNFTTSTTVYDTLGGAHTGTLYFEKTGTARQWNVYMAVKDSSDQLYVDDGGGQTVTFDESGAISTINGTPIASAPKLQFFGGQGTGGAFTYDPGNGAYAMGFDVDIGDVDNEGIGESTQYSGESNVNSLVQDGYTTGRLSSIDIDDSGVVFARYTNGQSNPLGAVALANFNNASGLQPVGDTNWVQTFESGDVIYGQANNGSFGAVQSGALEASNVDLSKELVDMITAQRNYQANAKMITTEDQVTQTVINIR